MGNATGGVINYELSSSERSPNEKRKGKTHIFHSFPYASNFPTANELSVERHENCPKQPRMPNGLERYYRMKSDPK
jgi:hypothetical protein